MDDVELDTGAAHDTSEPPARAVISTFGYQPALDGVRAFAIVGVLLFHLPFRNHSILDHGLLGVDMFFVLSGFLITTLLLRERTGTGRISLPRFYLRRALRLLPLLACMLVVALVVNLAFPPGYPGRPDRQGITAAAFYYANWYSLHSTPGLGFLGVTWSLSIEEQFYLCWPLLLIGLLALKRSRRTVALTVCGATLVAIVYRMSFWYRSTPTPSFVDYYLRLTARGRRPPVEPGITRVYFGSDTRAHQLLLGCAVAALLWWLAPRISEFALSARRVAGIVAAVVAVALLVNRPYTTRAWLDHWGSIIFEFAVAVLIAALVLLPGGLLARALSWRPLTWTGQRAYGIYLIHPVVYQYLGAFHLGDWGSLFLHLAVVFAAAWFAFKYIETPALQLKRRFSA